MIAWTIAQIALLGGLLALAAWGAEAALRAAGRPTRWAWVGALLTTLALALLTPLRTGDDTATPIITATSAAAATTTTVAAPSGLRVTLVETWHRLTASGERAVQDAWAIWHGAVPASTDRVLLLAWIVASAVLLIAFVAVHQRFARRRAQWPVHTLLDTPVRVADNIGPAVIGVTRAEIVVPQWLLTRETREQQLVLAHEREHVRLHDPLLLAMAQAVIVLLPWHPAVWWMASRLRLAVELDCDRRVLQRGASARDYGTLLIDLTDHRAGFGAALPAFSCTPSHLERRLIAMTPKKVRYPLVRALSATAFASLALLAACEAKLPTDAEVENMSATTAVSAAGRVAMLDTNTITYFVNGTPLTKAAATSIAPDSIASVEVMKKSTGGEVHIFTKGAVTPLTAARVTYFMPGDTAGMAAKSIRLRRLQKSDGSAATMERDTVVDLKRTPATGTQAAFTGLVMVDGVARESSALSTITPDQIVTVNVIKGAAASAKYSDPRAVNGVIEIVTKKAKP